MSYNRSESERLQRDMVAALFWHWRKVSRLFKQCSDSFYAGAYWSSFQSFYLAYDLYNKRGR